MELPEIIYPKLLQDLQVPVLRYDRCGNVFSVNDAYLNITNYIETEVIGRNIRDILFFPFGDSEMILQRFFCTGRNVRFKILVKRDETPDKADHLLYAYQSNLHSIISSAHVYEYENSFFAVFEVKSFHFPNFVTRYYDESYVAIDTDNKVFEYNNAFFLKFHNALKLGSFYGMHIRSFFRNNGWEAFLARKDESLRKLQDSAAASLAPWEKKYEERFVAREEDRWIFDKSGVWSFKDGILSGQSSSEFSYAIFKPQLLNLHQHDLKIEFKARGENRLAFGCFFGGKTENYFLTPDSSGYMVGVIDDRQFIKRRTVEVGMLKQNPFPDNRFYSVSVEKTGSRISLSINGNRVLEYFDQNPGSNILCNTCGYFCYGITEFKDFVIYQRAAGSVPTLPEGLMDVELEGTPGEIYEIEMTPAPYMQHPVSLIRLRDVTHLRRVQKSLLRTKEQHLSLLNKHKHLRAVLQAREKTLFIGNSPIVERIMKLIENVSNTDVSVLITGETGTGKDLLARQIHLLSQRKSMPFMKIDCASLPSTLLESELFGHEKGAFTGASEKRIGRFEESGEGTVFLDEISNLDLSLQAKLLRVLQDRCFERLGSTQTLQMRARIVTASNLNIEESVRKGLFRQDLLFRINTIQIHVPALRERKEDIPLLANIFLNRFAIRHNRPVKQIGEKTLAALSAYDWPGNVRELQNAMEHAVLFCQKEEIHPSDLPVPIQERIRMNFRGPIPQSMDAKTVLGALDLSKGNISKTAGKLGISRSSLYQLLYNFGIRSKELSVEGTQIERQQGILNVIKENPGINLKELLLKFNSSRRSLQRDLCALIKRRKIIRKGAGANTRYECAGIIR